MTFREIDAEDFVCHRCGHVSVVKETPQEVIAAIFGKSSAQVTGKMNG